jgi:uncharacterized protein
MTVNLNRLVVIKMNPQREEIWRYDGQIIQRTQNCLVVEAFFNISDKPFHGITIRTNDRSIEWFFSDRWYNIFEIHDRDDDHLKAWYCNITMPAEFSPGIINYIDLALDVLVYPDGSFLVLDEDEFDELELDPKSRVKALEALDQLVSLVETSRLQEVMK